MSVREMASTTMLWMKEASTHIFLKMGKRLSQIEFVQRNRRWIAVCLLIWLLGILAGYLIFQSAVGQLKNGFYQLGVSATEKLGAKTGQSLLEKDILSLNVAIGEIANDKGLIYAAILDHENKIVAHSDPELINRPFTPLKNGRYVDTVGKVFIHEGSLPDNERIISFSLDVLYAGINIGKVYFVQSASELYSSLNRYKILFISGVVLVTLLLSVILVVRDRTSKAKALKIRKELKGMTRIGPYLLIDKIAQGGMAELFLADYEREDGFRRTVAVKKVLPHLAENSEFIKMFIREARLAAMLQHPNIVQTVDFGKIQNAYFIAMDYIRGKNLAEIMAMLKEGLAVDQAVFIVSQVCMGLHYSHSKKDDKSGKPLNIVHRDISPQNILISLEGEVKISDFGISKARSEPSLTQAGVIKGKLSYLSPEQALGQTVDHQADIYALGIVFYEILSGKRLYRFSSDVEAIRSIPEMEIDPIKKLRPDIPVELNSIVMKCLEKDKKLRYQSAQEFLDDLIALKQSFSITYDRSNLSGFMKRHFKERG